MCTAVHGYSALQRKLCWQREAACPASEAACPACDRRDHLLHHLQWPTDDAARDGDDDDAGDDDDDDDAGDDDDDGDVAGTRLDWRTDNGAEDRNSRLPTSKT